MKLVFTYRTLVNQTFIWKILHINSGDPDYDSGAERTIQDMLPEVLHQYGVLDVDESWRSKPMHFEDVRLQKAWQQAMEQGKMICFCFFALMQIRKVLM